MTSSETSRDYSRTEYVFGKEALNKMENATFLIIGCSGTGAEVAKDIFLTGCSIEIYDPTLVTSVDLCSNPFLTIESINERKDKESLLEMASLNPEKTAGLFDFKELSQLVEFSAVIYTENVSKFSIFEISEYCHNNLIPFIVAESIGLAGRVFCDFGDEFEVLDRDGEQVEDMTITSVMIDFIDKKPIISIEASEKTDYIDGELVFIKDVNMNVGGNEELSKDLSDCLNNSQYRILVTGMTAFELVIAENSKLFTKLEKLDNEHMSIDYLRGGYSMLIKEPLDIHFESFSNAIKEPRYAEDIIDFVKIEYRDLMHKMFCLVDEGNALPQRPYDIKEMNEFIEKIPQDLVENNRSIAELFTGASLAQLSTVSSIIGGWGAEEALIAVSGKFTPIEEFFYFDCFELIKEIPTDAALRNNRYDGQIAAFGLAEELKLENRNVFLVGAGALGCELLKIFALSGAATAEKTTFYVTDPDQIENSNLSREFLFREADSGKMKSQAACQRIKSVNSEMNINYMTEKLSESNPLSAEFWSAEDIVCNALDNVEARRFVDSKCVEYVKPLLESGTLGSKANTEIVIPRLTQIYSARSEESGGQAPACTIHNFPNNITHCIVYVMSEFCGLFEKAAGDLKRLFACKSEEDLATFVTEVVNDEGKKERIIYLAQFCNEQIDSINDCIIFTLRMFKRYFVDAINTLLDEFPPDAKNNDGTPFWAGEKRPPKALLFDSTNEACNDFLAAGTKLFASLLGLKFKQTDIEAQINKIIEKVDISEIESFNTEVLSRKIDESDNLAELLGELILYRPKNEPEIIKFEKDDPNNGHIEFVSGFANLRAQNYNIPNVDSQEIRRISGNIVPAMITTTAAICGHVGIEYYKICFGFNKIEDYKEVFMNFAIPLLQFSENESCNVTKVGEKALTIWDSFVMYGDVTVQQVIDYIREKVDLTLDSIMVGSRALYMSFMDKPEKKERKVRELVAQGNKGSSGDIDSAGDIVLQIMPEDDEIELPNLKLLRE